MTAASPAVPTTPATDVKPDATNAPGPPFALRRSGSSPARTP
ncbi:MAG: hypothetical protein R2734_11420 [Nocardioides sp.]